MTTLTNGKTFESASKELKSVVKFSGNVTNKLKSVTVALGETLHFIFLKDRHLYNMPTFTHEEIVEIVKRTDYYTTEYLNIQKKSTLKAIETKKSTIFKSSLNTLLANSATQMADYLYQETTDRMKLIQKEI